MPLVCKRCRKLVEDPSGLLRRVSTRYPDLELQITTGFSDAMHPPQFYRASGCENCRGTGYHDDIGIFDLYRNDPAEKDPFSQKSLFSFEEYAFILAAQGSVDLLDLLDLENSHLRRVHQLLTTSERSLSETNSTLNRKLLELEASNRVLLQRTEVLMSLQELGQALITSTELGDLAARICRRASDLCGADRVVLYLNRSDRDIKNTAEILAERGWGNAIVGKRLDSKEVFGLPSLAQSTLRAARYVQVPPGLRTHLPGSDAVFQGIKTGINMPLFAQDQLVGMMILQSTQRDFFTQGEMALLQTFANQAALAIQRAGLIEDLRAKITQLEAAQGELVKKERMERELELARQVQQSMLPRSFPIIPGYALSARNEPARQVGGDFYDAIQLDEDHFGLVVADVSDKGLPAALYMSLTRSILLAESRRTLSPREALINVNNLLQEVGDLDGFVSIFYGVMQVSTRQFTYARAGHERPLLLRGLQTLHLDGAGIVLGIVRGEDFNLGEEVVVLQPGDCLVLYTDGLTDVLNSAGYFAGSDQFESLLQNRKNLTAEEICTFVFQELTSFRGEAEQFDDMTLLVLRVNED